MLETQIIQEMQRLDNLSIAQLEELQDQVFDFTDITNLESWLDRQVTENH